jgi:predicted RNase H-like nuclease
LDQLVASIDGALGIQEAAHAADAIVAVDEPMRLLHGLKTDSDLEAIANGLFQSFDNGLQPNQRPSHLFIADTNHFALPLLLAAQAREGNEARDNAVLMPLHELPCGGNSHPRA